jgi:sodium/potassium-transporting ATPase subunit beta
MADQNAAETETFIRRAPKKTTGQAFSSFLYDKDTKKVLSRTCSSWLEITIFYVVFYACLAAFWATLLAGFVATLDDKVPRYYGKGSIIGINPGMGYQPWLKEDPDTTFIHFDPKDKNTWTKYQLTLADYIYKYDNKTATRKCSGPDDNNAQLNETKACEFDTAVFAPACTNDTFFGYDKGSPCVAVSLNRLIGWVPLAYPAGSGPAQVGDRYNSGDVAIDCRGQNPADREHLKRIDYFPESGLMAKYYPYRVMDNYHQPIAMVKFNDLPKNVMIQIECRAYAYNVIHDPFDRQGLIQFEIMIADNQSS